MRKLVLQMQMTLDGFVARPDGQMDWMTPEMDEQQLQFLQEITAGMDTILLGRKMVQGFTTYWESVVDNQPDSPEYPYAKIFVNTPKIVFSRTLNDVKGRNVVVENGDLVTAVNTLKNKEGKNLIVYGGANFVSELIKNNLIDELNLLVHPVAIGSGLRIFTDRFSFKLVKSAAYGNGIVLNRYEPV